VAVIAASILDADYANLRHEVTRVARAGVDAFSLDVMDGRFVPRLTFGDYVVAQVRRWVDLPLEVHLMVEQPERWIRPMCDAGADLLVFHLEATDDPVGVIERIRAEGRCAGLALGPETPVDHVTDELIASLDLVNLVAVRLGFGGSESASDTLARIAGLRTRADALGGGMAIEVDGGVKPSNANTFTVAGADMLTSGTGIYHAADVDEAVQTLRATTSQSDYAARARLERFLSVPSSRPVDDRMRRVRLEELRDALDVPTNVWDPATD
jgi:ribulose-phosphate 3-epimerase